MRVNFSITNQLATPSIHAAALANRPPAGQPGRLFVDTNSPSSGIYRDTGTAWILISSPGAPEADTLQAVTDRGNTTTNNIQLTFADNTSGNKLSYYNTANSQTEFVIEKRASGILLNECLVIESAKTPIPSTDKIFGILLEPANQRLFTYYDIPSQVAGLYCNFSGNEYNLNGYLNATSIGLNDNNKTAYISSQGEIILGDVYFNYNGTQLKVDDQISSIKSKYQGNDIGLYLDFANNVFTLGDTNFPNDISLQISATNDAIVTNYNGAANGLVIDFFNGQYALGDYNTTTFGTQILIDNQSGQQSIRTLNNSNYIGLLLDFGLDVYRFGNTNNCFLETNATYVNIGDINGITNGTTLGINDNLETIIGSGNLLVGTSGPVSGQHLKIRVGGTDYVIELKNP